jgi:hypothetical protein
MASVPGLVCKTGAEGVFAAGLPDGRGLAMKVDDGGGRARPVVLAAALRRMGLDNEVIRARGDRPVLGGAVRVGHIRPGPPWSADRLPRAARRTCPVGRRGPTPPISVTGAAPNGEPPLG